MSNRIRQLREAQGLTQQQLGDRMGGVSKTQISRYESGAYALREKWIRRFAAALGVDAAEILVGGTKMTRNGEERFTSVTPPAIVSVGLDRIPIVGAVQAGRWVEAMELPVEEWEHAEIYVADRFPRNGRFGLRVLGRSMDKKFEEGTILVCLKFFDLGRAPESGEFVIAMRRTNHSLYEATVKEYVVMDGRRLLVPHSTVPAYQEPIEIPPTQDPLDQDAEVWVYARVVGYYKGMP